VAIPAIHPGEHLAEEVKELGMSAAELAPRLEVPTNRVTEILNGRRAITGDTALRLAHFFETDRRILAQPPKPLRAARRTKERRKVDRPAAHAEASRGSTCLAGILFCTCWSLVMAVTAVSATTKACPGLIRFTCS